MQVSWGLLCFRPPGLPGGGGEYEQFPSGNDSYGTFRGAPALPLTGTPRSVCRLLLIQLCVEITLIMLKLDVLRLTCCPAQWVFLFK